MDSRHIRILKATVCGGQVVAAGQVVEATLSDARYLVNTGRAEPCEAQENAPKGKAPKRTINKMVDADGLETRDAEGE